MTYFVKQLFGRGPEQALGSFNDEKLAIAAIEKRLAADASYNVKASYRLYEDDELRSEWDQVKWQKMLESKPAQPEDHSSAASSATASTAFRPTPLSTSPRPKGTPAKSLIDPTDEKKDN